jgi:hypothetical protein
LKKILVLLAVVMALFLAMPLAASPSAIEPAMSLDTLVEADAVISVGTVVDTARLPTRSEGFAYFVVVSLLIAALVGSATLLLYVKDQISGSEEKRIHHARDQPAAAA